MSARYPSRTKSASKRGSAGKVPPQSPAHNSDVSVLGLPKDLRTLLYMDEDLMCIQYAQLEQYFMTPNRIFARANDTPPPKDKPSVFIEIESHTPVTPARSSVNILPYIWLYLTFKHIRFHFLTENDHQGQGLTDLASQVHRHADDWRKLILESGNVEEVQVWWKEKYVDIALKRDSKWAIDWNCHVEDSAEVVELKRSLGLLMLKPKQWKGAVVVASVEA